MKKFTLALITSALITGAANAQMPYTLTVKNESYTPLTSGATSINGTDIWQESNYSVPLTFNMNIGGKTTSRLFLSSSNSIGSDTAGIINGFLVLGAEVVDRGLGGSASKSPIRYAIAGTAGSRIFKLEVFNAGFADEHANYATLNDSLSYQVWLYEGSNVVEYHYGPSRISHASDYFPLGGPLMGYMKNNNIETSDFEKWYLLKGSATAPTVDSISGFTGTIPALNAYPPSGTVYRFTPKNQSTAVSDLLKGMVGVYPTRCTSELYIDNVAVSEIGYKLVALNGVTLQTGKAGKGKTALDVSGLAQGMYFLQLESVAGSDVRKFVKL